MDNTAGEDKKPGYVEQQLKIMLDEQASNNLIAEDFLAKVAEYREMLSGMFTALLLPKNK